MEQQPAVARGGGRGFGAGRGGGRGRGQGKPGGRGAAGANGKSKKQQQQQQKGAPSAAAPPPEKHIVIITNVETDFAAVHEDRLASFLCLDPTRHRRNVSSSSSSGGGSGKATKKKGTEEDAAMCSYDLVCRSETRSAELSVYGRADANPATVFASSVIKSGNAVNNDSDNDKEKGEEKGGKSSTADPTALDMAEDLTKGATANSARGHAFNSLPDLAAALSGRPYFTRAVPIRVHEPGRDEGEELAVSDVQKERLAQAQERAAAAFAAKRARTHPAAEGDDAVSQKKKRQRTDADGDDAVEKEKEEAASQSGEDSGDDVESAEDAAHALQAIRQFSSRQKELVTAVAAVSAPQWTARQLQQQLKDLPGFLSCWRLYAKHFRVVFQNDDALFRAKQLLDQFQLDGNVRVTLSLSDALSRKNSEFLAKEEAMDVEETEPQ